MKARRLEIALGLLEDAIHSSMSLEAQLERAAQALWPHEWRRLVEIALIEADERIKEGE